MEIEYDPNKNAANIEIRGLSFELMKSFDWESAVSECCRTGYEARTQLTGYIGKRLHIAIITSRGNAVRVISLRKANKREVKKYAQKKT